MLRAILTLSSLSICLGACTSVEALRPDMEARSVPSRLDEIAYINGLREAYSLKTGADCYNGKNLDHFNPKYSQGFNNDDPDQNKLGTSQCVEFKKLGTTERDAAILRYLESGFGLTDLYCQRFFVIATQTRRGRVFQRDTGSTADALVNTVMNALGGGPNLLTIANGGFEAFDSTYKNIDTAFVIAPDREDVRKLVLGAQQDFRAQAFKTLPTSYPGARSVVERYAGICSFDGMRQLVADAVSAKAKELDAQGREEGGAAASQQPGITESPTATGATTAKPVEPRDRIEGVSPPVTPPRTKS